LETHGSPPEHQMTRRVTLRHGHKFGT
jgi:hypothetical protein